ncbi:MAG: hypothetical protein IIB03_05165 [Acidobacteria bacterium]|nr:hypothetical protein [Acidobacteriota bacterium]
MVEQLTTDFRSAPLDPETLVLLEFAEKVTLTPSQVVDEDLEKLRQAGFSDDDIYLTTHIIGIFNYLVRLADVFDLDLDPEVNTETRGKN